jgi:integrase
MAIIGKIIICFYLSSIMATIYTRKYKNGYRVYFKLKNSRGKWVAMKTEILLHKLYYRNGKIQWPSYVTALKNQLEVSITLNKFGLADNRKKKNIPVSGLLELFLSGSGKKRKKSTERQYREAVKKFIFICGDKFIADVTHEDVCEFRDAMCEIVSPVSTRKFFNHLRGLFNWAADPENNYLIRSPISRSIRIKVHTPERPAFTDSEMRRVFQKAMKNGDFDLKNQLEFLLLTGFRANESCTYRLDQFDFRNKVIRHYNEKRDDHYPYPMDDRLERFLKRLPKTFSPYAFRYRHPSTIGHYLKKIIRDLGYDERLSPHSLKVTYVNRLKRAGLSSTEIHLLSHHKSFQTTMIYIRRDIGELRKALKKSR